MKQPLSQRSPQGFAATRRGALFVLALAASGVACAQAPRVCLNGAPLTTTHPLLEQAGTLLLPMRDLCAALAVQVKWFAAERKIELQRGDRLVELWIMTPVAQVNHDPVQLALPPLVKEGVTYLPLRVVGEAFGCAVEWDATPRTVALTSAP